MSTAPLHRALETLLAELADGAPSGGGAFVLNSGDAGLLRSLDKLSAEDASQSTPDGATIAAHAEHLRYGISLMNAWARDGGNPFAEADWGRAWQTAVVDEDAWRAIRDRLRAETASWRSAIATPRELAPMELTGMIGSVVHLAYHLGAIRQISRAARGPKDAEREE